MLAIFDYKAGNQTSVHRALKYLGIANTISNDPEVLASAQGIIFPGVGAAGQAMEELRSNKLDKTLYALVQQNKPVLGICVGCQILLDYCQENDTKSLGILSGECVLFDTAWQDEDGRQIRVPHMGWNKVVLQKQCLLFEGIDPEANFYFVHSYYPRPHENLIIGTTQYGQNFCSIFGRTGLWAVQFHPEKSGAPGLQLLQNFYAYCQGEQDAE